ncbi:hypothetical protein RUM43_008391 [Polyplax serrata]|uniref:Uncharacterized protein n=1 Tax=Polyplax serrata TaxID=468196 RepID=A0AAN8S8Z9_POLSC
MESKRHIVVRSPSHLQLLSQEDSGRVFGSLLSPMPTIQRSLSAQDHLTQCKKSSSESTVSSSSSSVVVVKKTLSSRRKRGLTVIVSPDDGLRPEKSYAPYAYDSHNQRTLNMLPKLVELFWVEGPQFIFVPFDDHKFIQLI